MEEEAHIMKSSVTIDNFVSNFQMASFYRRFDNIFFGGYFTSKAYYGDTLLEYITGNRRFEYIHIEHYYEL